MVRAKSRMGFRRGDIVWARVLFPGKWWPGLVLSIDGHWVAVSFFDGDTENPRYFLETEVRSFEENFNSLTDTLNNCSRGEGLLDHALKLLARRVTWRLRCPCHFRSSGQGRKISKRSRRRGLDSFQPDELLSFVVGLAVSPFVGASDFVNAVTAAAQLHVFRGYVIGEQKLLLDSKATGSCSLAQKSDASALKFKPLNGDQPNNKSLIQICRRKTQLSHDMLVNPHCFVFYENHTMGGFLNTLEQNCMTFRNLGCQTILSFEISKCCQRSSEVQYSPQSVKAKRKDCWDIYRHPKPYIASPITLLGLKRKYNHPVDSDFCFQLCNTAHLFSINGVDADLQKSEMGGNVCGSDVLISIPFFDFSLNFCSTMPLSFSDRIDAPAQIQRTRCEENTSDSFSSGSQLDVGLTDHASVKARNYLPSPTTNQIKMDHGSDNHNISVETNRRECINAAFREKSVENKTLFPHVTSDASSSVPQVAQQSSHGNFTNQYLYMKFPRDINLPSKKDLIRKFSRFGKIDLVRTKIFTGMGSAQVVFLHQHDCVAAYQFSKKKKSLFGGANILFWLDPYEKKRGGSRSVVPMPNLKPCLKNADLHGQECKKIKKVRFMIRT